MNDKLETALKNKNVLAFLQMIRHSEGTAGPDGYRTLFGGKLFDNAGPNGYRDHPGLFFNYTNKAGQVIRTSAAGAYQITHSTWVELKEKLALPNFSPHNQDIAACKLIDECSAVSLIEAGNFTSAVDKCRKVWASLPGSGCNQPERSMAEVQQWYLAAGGSISPAVS